MFVALRNTEQLHEERNTYEFNFDKFIKNLKLDGKFVTSCYINSFTHKVVIITSKEL